MAKELKNLKDLAENLGYSGDVRNLEARIAKALFKNTACGVSFWVRSRVVSTSGAAGSGTTEVNVAGYAEGYAGELPTHTLVFPFTSEEFWDIVTKADIEGCQMWDEVNGEGDDDYNGDGA